MKILNTFIFCFALLSCKNTSGHFARFLNLVPQADLPFELDIEDWKEGSEYLYLESLHYPGASFREQNPIIKSKENLIHNFIGSSPFVRVPPSIFPVIKFQPHRDRYAIVYAYRYESASTPRGSLFLRIFDNNGKNLETVELTRDWHTSILISSITFDGIIKQENYKKIWNLDFETHQFENNEVVDYKLDKVQYYEINRNGKLNLMKEHPAGFSLQNELAHPFVSDEK